MHKVAKKRMDENIFCPFFLFLKKFLYICRKRKEYEKDFIKLIACDNKRCKFWARE